MSGPPTSMPAAVLGVGLERAGEVAPPIHLPAADDPVGRHDVVGPERAVHDVDPAARIASCLLAHRLRRLRRRRALTPERPHRSPPWRRSPPGAPDHSSIAPALTPTTPRHSVRAHEPLLRIPV